MLIWVSSICNLYIAERKKTVTIALLGNYPAHRTNSKNNEKFLNNVEKLKFSMQIFKQFSFKEHKKKWLPQD